MTNTTPKQQINIKLDLQKGWVNPKTIQLKQSDHNARIFMIRLVNTLPINLTGCQPTLFVKRADGTVVTGLGQMTRAEQGEFLVPLNSTVLGVVGQTIVEVVIVKDGEEILSFPHFNFEILESFHNSDEVTEGEEVGILWELIGETRTALDEMDGRFVDFVNAKDQEFQRAEQVRNQNETVRQEGYTEMQNKVNQVYSTTLKYRIVE